jgi:hypothetical protein
LINIFPNIKFYPSPHDEMNIHHQSPLSIEQEFMNLALDNQKGVHVSWREINSF